MLARVTRWIATLNLMLAALAGWPGAASAQDVAGMKARYVELRDKLANNPFRRPLYLESTQTSDDLKGDVYAVVDQPYTTVAPALQGVAHWCDLLILHLNVKYCGAAPNAPSTGLSLIVGRKSDQPIEDAYRIDFAYKLAASTPDYLRVQLYAESGPLSTKNYRIVLEAVPLDAKRSFLHMAYSYAYGFAARIAMQSYLGTVGRDKVGFSIVDHTADGKPVYVDNVRGVLERNTMRYYLAIESYLGAYDTPRAGQVEKRLSDWYASTERYPLQLHELDRNEYMTMKRHEVQRQAEGVQPK